MITQAFVLGAGLGTRLRPLTEDCPKPLIPIFQKPLITFALDHLASVGVKSFVLNTHHRAELFETVFTGGGYAGLPLQLVHEPVILGTGGGIKNVERFLKPEPFIVYSGDVLTDIDLAPLIDAHVRDGNDVTLALRETGLAAGVALQAGRVVDIGNKFGHAGEFDFANVSVWNPEISARIPAEQALSFIPIIREWIGQGGKIGGVVLNGNEWFNIGSRNQYLDVHRFINERDWKPNYVNDEAWPVRIAPDAVIAASARITGFCSIGSGCQVAGDAVVEDCILWAGAQIASRSRLRNCIVRTNRTAEGNLSDTDI